MNGRHGAAVAALLCFVLGIALAFAAAIAQRNANARIVEQRFKEVSELTVERVVTHMRSFEFGLRGMRGVVVAEGGLPRLEQVRRYAASRDIAREFAGARGFGLIWRVAPQDQQAFLEHMRADGRPGFALQQIAPHAGERFVISFIEPEAANAPALGLDIASEPRRRDAALAAQASGRASISAPITLVQSSGQVLRSFLLLLPITRAALDGRGADGEVAGWSYAPIVSDEVLSALELPENLVWLELRDADATSDAVFYSSAGNEPRAASLPAAVVRVEMFNRHWRFRLRATEALAGGLNLTPPALVGALATLLAALLAVVVFLLGQRRQRALALRRERAERAAIVEASDDGILGIGLDGIVSGWNHGAQRLFGIAPAEVIGRPLQEVLPPPGWLDEDAAILASASAGTRMPPFETQRRHRDGSLVDVSLSAAPILDAEGRVVSLALTFRDIRAAKAARRELEALNASLERQVRERTAALDRALHDLRNIVDALPSMIGYWDSGLRNRMANRAYARWFGVAPEDVQGIHFMDLLGVELYQLNRPYMEAALRGQPQTFQRSIPRPDGHGLKHSLAHYLPDIVDGEVRGFYVLVHDITELQEQRTALEAEQRDKAGLLAMMEAHAIVSTTDRDGVLVAVNERFCQLSGYAAHELLGRTHKLLESGQHEPAFWASLRQAVAAGDTWHGEICNRARDGSLYWTDSVVAPFFNAQGEIERIIAFGFDVTARKHIKGQLRQALATLEAILRSATQVAIVATGTDGVVSLFNRGAERMLGYDAQEIVGRETPLRWHLADELQARAAILARRHGRSVAAVEALNAPEGLDEAFDCHYLRRDGTTVPVTLAVSAIVGADQAPLGFIHVAYDIRERQRQEAALKDAVAAAQLASEAKSHFLANMSHEIRTPLNAVIGLAHLLEKTRLDPEQSGYVNDIGAAGGALLAVLNDVLDLSRIEAGEMALERVTFSLRDLCSDLQSLFGAQARDKGLGLRLLPHAALPDALVGDPTRLRQILVNLLGNAIKFTHHGHVGLEVRCIGMDALGCRLRFEVDDTGIGIEPAMLERLFTPFVQADASTTRKYGGSGLGLSIVKHLAEMMGGRVEADSTPGAGSRFRVELPFELGDAATLVARLRVSGQGPRLAGVSVLLVDDSEINLTVAGKLLEIEGARVTKARNGAEAVRIARERFDLQLILMDIQMPVMDGLTATREILGAERLVQPRIVALTAGNLETERPRAREAGCLEVLSKPIDPEVLIQAMRKVLSMPAPTPAAVELAARDDWPAIAGIDGAEVRRRLAGDLDMYRRMLAGLLDEAAAAAADGAPDKAELAARMHKLKGNAATLAAAALAQAAEEVEAACSAAPPEAPRPALERLARQVQYLRRAAAPFLERAPQRAPHAGAEALDSASRAALLQALRAHELGALALFRELAPVLRAEFGAAGFAILEAHVEHLRFEEAVVALLQHRPVDGI